MASIPMLPAGASSSDVVACLENAGCVVVRGVTDDTTRESLQRELAPQFISADAGNRLNRVYEASGGNGSFYPGNTKRITALVAKSETFRGFVQSAGPLAKAPPSCFAAGVLVFTVQFLSLV